MKGDPSFIKLIDDCEKTILKHNPSGDPILTTMLELLEKLRIAVQEETLNKKVTTLGIVRYVGEYDLPNDIVSSVEKIHSYYHSVYKTR
ncbi:hypothetical protein ACSVDE_17230 [Pseudalkalibacillus sp. Hm43]|uniref:hypothetical protein n=1 Tax=Pseudalkalibacillus sp. Hm43 TaxID=3450742 RepID=UPI003F43B9B4